MRFVNFVEGVWHPEDLVRLPGTPWIVVSAMRSTRRRGALLALKDDAEAPPVEMEWRAPAAAGRLSPATFDPHGIDVRSIGGGLFELLVVDHGGGEAIDRLTVDVTSGTPTIVAGARIDKPAGTSGNAVAFLPGGGFVMTSMFDPGDAGLMAKFAAGSVTGRVWRWDERELWRPFGPPLSGANGIAVDDGGMIYVSEWSARRVWKLAADGTEIDRVELDFLPDNLRWSSGGDHLLLAGQIDRPERVFACEARGQPCPLAFAVVRLDPLMMRVTPCLRVHHEAALAAGFGGATGALDVGDETWVGSFTGERIARYRRAG